MPSTEGVGRLIEDCARSVSERRGINEGMDVVMSAPTPAEGALAVVATTNRAVRCLPMVRVFGDGNAIVAMSVASLVVAVTNPTWARDKHLRLGLGWWNGFARSTCCRCSPYPCSSFFLL